MTSRRAPSREFAIGFGDFMFPISGKQGSGRSKFGVPSRDFLENFLQGLAAAKTPTPAAPAPAADATTAPSDTVTVPAATPAPAAVDTAKFAALFSSKKPRRGGFSYQGTPVFKAAQPASTEQPASSATAAGSEFSEVLGSGADGLKLFAREAAVPKGAGSGASKQSAVKKARRRLDQAA